MLSAHIAISGIKKITLSCTSLTKTLRLTRSGLENACLLKQSGNSQLEVDFPARSIHGATSFIPTESGWRIRTRGNSQILTTGMMDTQEFRRSLNFLRTVMAYTTWREMSGSGLAIGIG